MPSLSFFDHCISLLFPNIRNSNGSQTRMSVWNNSGCRDLQFKFLFLPAGEFLHGCPADRGHDIGLEFFKNSDPAGFEDFYEASDL